MVTQRRKTTADEYAQVIKLKEQGIKICDIVSITGLSRSIVNNWIHRKRSIYNGTASKRTYFQISNPIDYLNSLKDNNPLIYKTYSFLFGLYLGDGCITHLPRTNGLRYSLDLKYPILNEYVKSKMKELFPNNKIGEYDRSKAKTSASNCIILSTYMKSINLLFPQDGVGEKHKRHIILEQWQKDILDPVEIVRGLMYSDGSYFQCNTYNKNFYEFNNCSTDIINILKYYLDVLNIDYSFQIKKFHEKSTIALQAIAIRRKIDVEKLYALIGDKQNI